MSALGAPAPSRAEPPAGAPNRRSGPLVWLGVLALGAFLAGLQGATSPQVQSASQAARLVIEGTGAVRQAYWLRSRVTLSAKEGSMSTLGRRGLDSLQRLADLQHSDRALRMLALARHALGDPAWRRPLKDLATASPRRTRAEVDRELAFWRTALDPAARDTGEMLAARRFIRSLRLRWYENIALEALYESHGLAVEAARRRTDALRSTDLLTGLVAGAALLGIGGSVLWLVAAVLWVVRRKTMRDIILFKVRPLPTGASHVLCLVGAAYFVALIALRAVSPLVGRLVGQIGGSEGAPTARALANAMFAILALAPPVVVLLTRGKPLGLRPGDVGITALRPLRDVPAGLIGYAAVVPLLALSLAVSAALFEPSSSRINPAIMDYAMTRSLTHRLVLLALGAVIAPLTEEFVFRGVLLRALQPLLGFAGAALLTSALFAILHPQLPMGFLSIFVLGVTFSALYGLTGSLWPSILAHAINNGVVLAYLALYLGG